MKTLLTVLMCMLVLPVMAQDTMDTIPVPAETPGDPVTGETPEEPVIVLNATQQEKALRLSEASGVPIEEIIRMRTESRTLEPELPEGELPVVEIPVEGEVVPPDMPQGKGWGVICKWLGLHPSILGNGHAKQLERGKNLPDLPDLAPDDAVTAKKAMVRIEKEARIQVKSEEQAMKGKELAMLQRDKIHDTSGQSDTKVTGKPDKDKSDKGKPDKGKPDKDKPEKGKGN